jgi:hypothetical protein
MNKKQTELKKPVPTSVYLRKDLRAEVEKIAEVEGVTVHAIMAYGISYFVRQYKAGKVKLETEDRPKKLRLDI